MLIKYRWLIVYLLLLSATVGCDRSHIKPAPIVLTEQQASNANTSSSFVGWKTISGNGVKLSLPESYEGGDPNKDIDANTPALTGKFAEKLKSISPNFVEQLKHLKNNVPVVAFFAFDSKVNGTGFLTNINIVVDKVAPGTTIEEYLNTAIKQMEADYQIGGQKIISLEQYQAGQIIAESTSENVKIKQLIYVIPKENTFWLITYSTSTDEFEQRLPIFTQSIRTLKLNPS